MVCLQDPALIVQNETENQRHSMRFSPLYHTHCCFSPSIAPCGTTLPPNITLVLPTTVMDMIPLCPVWIPRMHIYFAPACIHPFSDSYIQSFTSLDDAEGLVLYHKSLQREENFLDVVLEYRSRSGHATRTNDSELAAFCAYACAYPNSCLCLIDTYDTLTSGLPNFIFVAKALDDFGYRPVGIRLDSGDLAALSSACRDTFRAIPEVEPSRGPAFGNLTIVASNDINEATLVALSEQDHGVTAFGIGTHLVTCQAQPALGCVYKLGESRRIRINFRDKICVVPRPSVELRLPFLCLV